MKLKRFLAAALVCTSAALLLGQDTIVPVTQGMVIDYDTRIPVPGLRVCLLPSNTCTITNDQGEFELAGGYRDTLIAFTGLGYDRTEGIMRQFDTFITYGIRQNPFSLSPAVVEGFLSPSQNASTPGSFGLIKPKLLAAGDEFALQNAMNTIPGVAMESRGYGGSQRIQIRGSFLRAPFAVRNIKMYMNGIPLSSPDGTAPLELIDAGDIRSAEVIKGPAGSAWGSGTGGVILFRAAEPEVLERSAAHQQTWGAFGLRRFHTAAELAGTWWGIRVSHVYQENDGYRDQEFNRKQQATLTARARIREKWDLFNYTTWYTGHWALPGALNAAQVEEDPSQANPFSEENNASVYRRRLFTGSSLTYRPNNRSAVQMTMYFTHTDKYNPYGTTPFFNGFKDEGATGAGGRVTASHQRRLGEWKLNAEAGGELQVESFFLDEYKNIGGLPGDHLFSYDADYLSLLGFGAVDMTYKNRLRLHTGLSAANTIHDITAYASDWQSSDTLADWPVNWLPRIGASVRLDSLIWWNASVSYGVSNPTIFEQIDPSVMVGPSQASASRIRPERGVNYETGFKGGIGNTGVEFELTAYWFFLRDIILPYQDSVITGELPAVVEFTRYKNEGATQQQGIEAIVRKSVRLNGWIERIDLQATFTRANYVFEEYALDDANWSEQLLPGIPLHSATGLLQLNSRDNTLQWSIQHFWNDRMPLNNANSDWLPAWHLLNSRVDVRLWRPASGGWEVHAFGGVNNALNTAYTSFPNVNDARGRYYNPAPGINAFGGIRMRVSN
jgi:iron complex outermembrane receptor protein